MISLELLKIAKTLKSKKLIKNQHYAFILTKIKSKVNIRIMQELNKFSKRLAMPMPIQLILKKEVLMIDMGPKKIGLHNIDLGIINNTGTLMMSSKIFLEPFSDLGSASKTTEEIFNSKIFKITQLHIQYGRRKTTRSCTTRTK